MILPLYLNDSSLPWFFICNSHNICQSFLKITTPIIRECLLPPWFFICNSQNSISSSLKLNTPITLYNSSSHHFLTLKKSSVDAFFHVVISLPFGHKTSKWGGRGTKREKKCVQLMACTRSFPTQRFMLTNYSLKLWWLITVLNWAISHY
jgi:hypothetical protein